MILTPTTVSNLFRRVKLLSSTHQTKNDTTTNSTLTRKTLMVEKLVRVYGSPPTFCIDFQMIPSATNGLGQP